MMASVFKNRKFWIMAVVLLAVGGLLLVVSKKDSIARIQNVTEQNSLARSNKQPALKGDEVLQRKSPKDMPLPKPENEGSVDPKFLKLLRPHVEGEECDPNWLNARPRKPTPKCVSDKINQTHPKENLRMPGMILPKEGD